MLCMSDVMCMLCPLKVALSTLPCQPRGKCKLRLAATCLLIGAPDPFSRAALAAESATGLRAGQMLDLTLFSWQQCIMDCLLPAPCLAFQGGFLAFAVRHTTRADASACVLRWSGEKAGMPFRFEWLLDVISPASC